MNYEYVAIIYTTAGKSSIDSYNLLLQNGWEPVRETSKGGGLDETWLCILRKLKRT